MEAIDAQLEALRKAAAKAERRGDEPETAKLWEAIKDLERKRDIIAGIANPAMAATGLGGGMPRSANTPGVGRFEIMGSTSNGCPDPNGTAAGFSRGRWLGDHNYGSRKPQITGALARFAVSGQHPSDNQPLELSLLSRTIYHFPIPLAFV
ncbi:hypothetical protein FWD20_03490 [Candidatus Saccharibacteria bacterium]|nr:hypothetical protein [Candidatus Saccharibacteria bacterium]